MTRMTSLPSSAGDFSAASRSPSALIGAVA
jgi:hypothetical protein